jgi:hypothetical protein
LLERDEGATVPLVAKGKKAKRGGKSRQEKPQGQNRALAESVAVFERGDYRSARKLLAVQADNSDLLDAERERARGLMEATGAERTALIVGASCAGLLMLLFSILQVTQP